MIETLQQIPGQTFLALFAGYSLICIVLGWLWANADGSTQYPLPELTRFDPIAIAALRGGWESVVRTGFFSLWNRGMLTIGEEAQDIDTGSGRSNEKPSGSVEEEIHRFFSEDTGRSTRDLFRNKVLRNRIMLHLEPTRRELEELHLVRTDSDRSRAWKAAFVMAFVIGAVGGTKLYLGIDLGRPVSLLVIFLVVLLIALFVILKPWAISTQLGRRYLKVLQVHHTWLKESVKEGKYPEGIDPSYLIAIFGVAVLGGTDVYARFSHVFSASTASRGFIGGCGGGGGGGCGGGCGGCGGG